MLRNNYILAKSMELLVEWVLTIGRHRQWPVTGDACWETSKLVPNRIGLSARLTLSCGSPVPRDVDFSNQRRIKN